MTFTCARCKEYFQPATKRSRYCRDCQQAFLVKRNVKPDIALNDVDRALIELPMFAMGPGLRITAMEPMDPDPGEKLIDRSGSVYKRCLRLEQRVRFLEHLLAEQAVCEHCRRMANDGSDDDSGQRS